MTSLRGLIHKEWLHIRRDRRTAATPAIGTETHACIFRAEAECFEQGEGARIKFHLKPKCLTVRK